VVWAGDEACLGRVFVHFGEPVEERETIVLFPTITEEGGLNFSRRFSSQEAICVPLVDLCGGLLVCLVSTPDGMKFFHKRFLVKLLTSHGEVLGGLVSDNDDKRLLEQGQCSSYIRAEEDTLGRWGKWKLGDHLLSNVTWQFCEVLSGYTKFGGAVRNESVQGLIEYLLGVCSEMLTELSSMGHQFTEVDMRYDG
jgi:hypothetical protein